MANGKDTKASKDEGYLSDESDFYGDAATKASFEERAAEFDDAAYWTSHQSSWTEKADASVAQALASPPPKVTRYNPYEGLICAWQLDETVEAFLKRSPPRATQASALIPWIYVANPFRKVSKGIAVDDEAPPDEDGDWGKCVTEGNRLLEELTTARNVIQKQNSGKSTIEINQLINKEKETIVGKILDMAVECRCTSGKWMIFSPPSAVDEIWSAIAKSTSTNSLGVAAKVAPNKGSPLLQPTHLICIYTENFADKMDVYRVLKVLREMGLVEKTQRGSIYYKPDQANLYPWEIDIYTYLQLDSSNSYGIKASIYNSLDFLNSPPRPPKYPTAGTTNARPTMKESGKVDSYFCKVKKEPSEMDWE
ncbi:hypothetical protein DSL72_000888 [Monilinia vaccinii-corymbosi]|uniref:DUF1917 domain-containing protein n=1 Tax=Monilinia vaccinii-corymbosi TaxID=61207 RepID=A0A8A3P0A1_9HELO|nr:hypothetical protein DSL72_000888 [Monilinia vaccinii-corymbosi]